MNRAQRRHHAERAKAEAKRKLKAWGMTITPKNVGTQAATHNTCPCWAYTLKDPEPIRKYMRDLNKLTHGGDL